MKHIRGQHTQTHGRPLWGITAGLLLFCAFNARAQSTIDPAVTASGGTSLQESNFEFYSTIGEPITTDSLGASDETTWGGFWQVLLPDLPSGVEEERVAATSATTGIVGVAPRPFTSSTAIQIQLARAGVVTISVYDLLGREVARLVDGKREPGAFLITWRPEGIDAGNYFIRLDVDGKQYPAVAVQYYR